MTTNSGHTAKAVANNGNGYWKDFETAKTAMSKEDPAEEAVNNFISGNTSMNTLMANLQAASARGEKLDLASTALEQHLLTVGGYNKPRVEAILAELRKIEIRTAGTRSKVQAGEQIKTALMAQRAKDVPRLPTPQENYGNLIRQKLRDVAQEFKQKPITSIG